MDMSATEWGWRSYFFTNDEWQPMGERGMPFLTVIKGQWLHGVMQCTAIKKPTPSGEMSLASCVYLYATLPQNYARGGSQYIMNNNKYNIKRTI